MSRNRKKEALRIFEQYEAPISAYFLSEELQISKAAARQLLHRLHKEGLIRRESRGFYILTQATTKDGIMIDAPLQLHGIKIVTKERHGLASVMSSQLLQAAPPSLHRHRINHSLTYSEEWEGRTATITIYHNEGAEINLSATNKPLSFPEFCEFCGWIQGKAPAGTLAAWEIRQLGLNYDIPTLHLDGISSITLHAFKNVWLRMYEHNKDRLRLEAHINIALSLPETLEILKGAMESAQQQVGQKIIAKVEK